jgi:DNA mismatch repair protein MutL
VKGWERLFENNPEDDALSNLDSEKRSEEKEMITFSSRANALEKKADAFSGDAFRDSGNTFQMENTYIVTQTSSGLLIFDQQAAHQRILYERYVRQLEQSSGASQQCLFPQNVTLSPADFALVMDLNDELANLGFQISVFGQNTVLINGVPADVHINSEKALFEELLEQFKHFKAELSLDKRENLARSLAKKSSIKKGDRLNTQEMENLAGQLFACQTPNYSPDGCKTFIKLDISKIERFFNF